MVDRVTQAAQADGCRAAVDAVSVALGRAAGARWQASPASKAPTVQDRGVGLAPSDPTADVALDTFRLALSEAVRRAEVALVVYAESLSVHADTINQTLADWEGRDE